MDDNFFYFALVYLNDWFYKDKRFCELLNSDNRENQLIGIQEAAKYYVISRNFKIIRENTRLGNALTLLNNTRGDITTHNVDQKVVGLSDNIKDEYNKNVISAASKLLWLKYKSPVIMYDSNAVKCLRSLGYHFNASQYASYRATWNECYNIHEEHIVRACRRLHTIKRYSLANNLPDEDIILLAQNRWFQERVFDKFLWFNGNNI